ncbi:MAG TPA: HNH endonuclease [Azospirillum sp.]|nr:HNH endonuclease [Azospirillum sp.]
MMTREDAQLMGILQGGRCFYCGEPVGVKATFDHVIPQAYGGVDEPGNIVLAHRRCNQLKGDRLPTAEEVERLLTQRRGSRLGVWPPIAALRDAEDEDDAWILVARAIAALPRGA